MINKKSNNKTHTKNKINLDNLVQLLNAYILSFFFKYYILDIPQNFKKNMINDAQKLKTNIYRRDIYVITVFFTKIVFISF